jgi:inhibitor of cysteine peptidase
MLKELCRYLRPAIKILVTAAVSTVIACHSEVRYTDKGEDGQTEVSGSLIIFTTNEELETYLKDQYSKSLFSEYSNALTERVSSQAGGDSINGTGSTSESSYDAPSANDISDYTGTNLQEAGVDESDVMKTDGTYLYIAGNDTTTAANSVTIVSVSNPMEIVSKITVKGSIDSMYLYGNGTDKKLLVLLYTPMNYGGTPWLDSAAADVVSTGIAYWIPVQAKTGVAIYDVTNPSTPEELRTVEADGYLVASRRIENHLHVVLQFLPDLPEPYSMEEDIKTMTLEDLMPFYSEVNGNTSQGGERQLIAPEDFYHPSLDGGGSIVSIMTFDLDDPALGFSSTGVVADASIVYASTDTLYCTSTYWNYSGTGTNEPAEQTVIYKFDISGGSVTGQGYASVSGRALNQFSLGEYEGVLRIATTTGRSWDTDTPSKNHVYCLKSQDGQLAVTGRLEDIAPGEELYSARFIGPRGYLVTFVTTDPLFTLDLSDPTVPKIVGELKVPGFSSYIHPWGDDYLITIGKDAIEDGDGFAWYQGMQLSIFDISDFSNPKLLKGEVIGDRGTSSEALYNHKAFTFWESEGLLALPIDLYELEGDQTSPSDFGVMTFKGLYVYRVSIEGGFEKIGEIPTPDALEDYWYFYNDWTRGIFIGDNVYAVTPEQVKSAKITDIANITQLLMLEGD